MSFPKDAEALRDAGYKWSGDAECKKCGDEIEWWITPSNAKMPMNPMSRGSAPAVKHFDTCTG